MTTRQFALERLDVLAHELSSLAEGGRNDFLNRAAFELGSYMAADLLDAGEIHTALEPAAQACGMDAAEARYTIGRSLQQGARKPLDGGGDLPPLPKPSAFQKAQEHAKKWTPLAEDEWTHARSALAPLRDTDPAAQELARRGLWPGEVLTVYRLTRDVNRNRAGALVFETHGPEGQLLEYRVRNLGNEVELKVSGVPRYSWLVTGHGAPTWCSPGYGQAQAVLLVEGELNGAAAWTAAHHAGMSLDVQGIAGAGEMPHLAGIKGRPVYLYADDDEAGHRCLAHLTQIAKEAGASEVRMLPFLTGGLDFCDLLGGAR